MKHSFEKFKSWSTVGWAILTAFATFSGFGIGEHIDVDQTRVYWPLNWLETMYGVIFACLTAAVPAVTGYVSIMGPPEPVSRRISTILKVATIIGAIEFQALLLWSAFVGTFGFFQDRLAGGMSGATWIVCFLLSVPVPSAVAPLLARWYPRWTAVWLIASSLISSALFFQQLMHTGPAWSESPPVDIWVVLWSLTLIVPFSIPMLVLGCWLLLHHREFAQSPDEFAQPHH